jgi:hypothetical protein
LPEKIETSNQYKNSNNRSNRTNQRQAEHARRHKNQVENCINVKLSSRQNIARDSRNLPKKTETSGQYKNSNNRSNRGPQSNFSTTQNHASIFFLFFFSSSSGRYTLAATTDNNDNDKNTPWQKIIFCFQGRTLNQLQRRHCFFFLFSSPEGVPVSIKQEQKTVIEIYEGIAHVGYPTWAVLPPTRKLNYPIIETGSDTMLRFVRGEKRDGNCYLFILFKLIKT